MSDNKYDFRKYVDRNQALNCSVPGCPNNRSRTALYCYSHQYTYKTYGHPRHRAIRAKVIDLYETRVTRVLLRNLTHSGIKSALEMLDVWLKGEDQNVPHFKRIAELKNTSPFELLVAISAIAHIYRTTDNFILDEKHYQYSLGHALLHKHKAGLGTGIIRGKERRDVGRYIKDVFGVLLIGISDAVIERDNKNKIMYQNFQKKLKP
jgi:hypothetical protein